MLFLRHCPPCLSLAWNSLAKPKPPFCPLLCARISSTYTQFSYMVHKICGWVQVPMLVIWQRLYQMSYHPPFRIFFAGFIFCFVFYIYLCVCMWTTVDMKPNTTFRALGEILSFHHMSSRDQTWVIRLRGKGFCLLGHFAYHSLGFLKFANVEHLQVQWMNCVMCKVVNYLWAW